MSDTKKMALIASRGTLDWAYPPFILASTAVAMDMEVQIFFTFYGLTLLKKKLDAKEAGVELYCCSAALDLHNMTKDDLIDEIDDVVGAAWMMDEALSADVVLNY